MRVDPLCVLIDHVIDYLSCIVMYKVVYVNCILKLYLMEAKLKLQTETFVVIFRCTGAFHRHSSEESHAEELLTYGSEFVVLFTPDKIYIFLLNTLSCYIFPGVDENSPK